jgi:cobalamin biosynthesis Mg chelatase CobN
LHQYGVVPEMCIQTRPFRSALATLILTTGLALCDTACASTKRSSSPASQAVGPSVSQRRNPPSVGTSKPRDAAAGVGVAASQRIETADTVATTKMPAPASVSTAGKAGSTTAGSTSSQSPSMTVTTTTQRRIDAQVEQTARSLWPFLIGVAIAVAAGLALLIRRPRIKAR